MLQKRYGKQVKAMTDWRYTLWNGWARIKCNWLGLHSYIPLEEWDMAEGTIRFRGNRCWVCNVD